ncbi:hypothetical protein KGM_203100 [Danaus plexippus plexippus]|uniref:Uncharacterized protein n=1 Tax=Danaus plexippus plexippus TaxID=278856 RepID=A0A212F4U1_DANPL|nr:hypothetical protein KGM_203100 [Danaus plexippus plexippus]
MSENVLSRFKGLCRCCHLDGSFKSLKESYGFRGKIEMYCNMLTETFGLQLSPETLEAGCNICDDCVVRLRDSTKFKHQVQACEEKFNQIYAQYCKNIKVETENDWEILNDETASRLSGSDRDSDFEVRNEVEVNEVKSLSDGRINDEFVNENSEGDIDIVKNEFLYPIDDKTVWDVGSGDNFQKTKAGDDIVSPGPSAMKKSRDGIVFEKCVNHKMCVTTCSREGFLTFDTKSTDRESESSSAGPPENSQVFGSSGVRTVEKRAKSRASTRRWRDKKKGVSGSSKKQPKTAAQRMREYRQRKKIAREVQLKRSDQDIDAAASTSSSRS